MQYSIQQLREADGDLKNLTDEQIVKFTYPDYGKYYNSEAEYAKAIGYDGIWPGQWHNKLSTNSAYQNAADTPPVLQSALFESAGAMVFVVVISWVIYKKYIKELLPAKTPARTGLVGAVLGVALTLSVLPHQFRSKDTANAVVASLVLLVMYAATGFFLGWVYRKLRPVKAAFGIESKPVGALSLLQKKADMQSVGAGIVADKPAQKIDLNLNDSSQPSAKTAANAAPDTDENHWATALAELDGGNRRQGVWAKAFADSDGDEVRAKVAYLKARVPQLLSAADSGLT